MRRLISPSKESDEAAAAVRQRLFSFGLRSCLKRSKQRSVNWRTWGGARLFPKGPALSASTYLCFNQHNYPIFHPQSGVGGELSQGDAANPAQRHAGHVTRPAGSYQSSLPTGHAYTARSIHGRFALEAAGGRGDYGPHAGPAVAGYAPFSCRL